MKLEKFKTKLLKILRECEKANDESVDTLFEELTLAYENQLDLVSMGKHNIRVHQEREQIGIRRLEKVVKYLEDKGLTINEINDIVRLEGENF
jgi:hypothetical protein